MSGLSSTFTGNHRGSALDAFWNGQSTQKGTRNLGVTGGAFLPSIENFVNANHVSDVHVTTFKKHRANTFDLRGDVPVRIFSERDPMNIPSIGPFATNQHLDDNEIVMKPFHKSAKERVLEKQKLGVLSRAFGNPLTNGFIDKGVVKQSNLKGKKTMSQKGTPSFMSATVTSNPNTVFNRRSALTQQGLKERQLQTVDILPVNVGKGQGLYKDKTLGRY